jgi:branched-subunit amino acid ABC-type transport system permease component
MEARHLRKTLLYTAVAVVLGLSMTLIPLVTLAELKPENHYAMPHSFSRALEGLEGAHVNVQTSSTEDVEVLAVSFAVAFAVYVLFKRRRPRQEYAWFRFPF